LVAVLFPRSFFSIMRVSFKLCYDGTSYSGWQIQPDVITVQGEIEKVLSTLYSSEVSIVGCGRTDKGVHARYYVAHADLPIENFPANLLYKLNRMLPNDISCTAVEEVGKKFHARFDATSRAYTYSIHLQKNPFLSKYSTFVSNAKELDLSLLQEVSDIIKRTSDFQAFCKLHGSESHTLCDIHESAWDVSESSSIKYHIRANRFLRGMVRLIVGSSLSVSAGKLSLIDLQEHIKQGSRSPHMRSAPPEGLALTDVQYGLRLNAC